ncbi:MAG: META domain-containing protein [Treponema sp.]|nr:META domain-containing protein [Treponema sp.]
MKKNICILVVLVAVCLVGCKSTPKFSDVSGKEWKLTDVLLNGDSINFDRNVLIAEGFGDIFTLTFETDRLGGVGAPNRYSAPYTLGRNQAISVRAAVVTMMAPLSHPEKLKEHDYFAYIQNTHKWDLVKGSLELSSKGEGGADVTMLFVLD